MITEDLSNNVHLSPEQVGDLKEQYGNVMVVEVPREDEKGVALQPFTICFKPNIKDKMAVFTLANKEAAAGKPYAFAKIILGAYIINGKSTLQHDDEMLISLMPVAQKLFEKGQAIIKN